MRYTTPHQDRTRLLSCSADGYQATIMLCGEWKNKTKQNKQNTPNQTPQPSKQTKNTLIMVPDHGKVFNWFGGKDQKYLIKFRIQGLSESRVGCY